MTTELARRLATRTVELCSIPSPYGEERALADHLEAWARALLPVDEVRREGNALVLGKVHAGDKPVVALVGHLDTVPGHPADGPPRLEGEQVVGLGASDMKAGLAVALDLFETLPRDALPVQPVLLLYDKEEGPHEDSGLKTVLARHPELQRIGLAFVMEPTDNVVQVGCVGSLHATVVFHGRAAHSARPWQGENAVTRAGALLARLHEATPREVRFGAHVFREVCTVTRAEGGRYRNVVPDRFELNLNYRFAPGKTLEAAQQELLELVGEGVEVSWTDLAPSGAVPTGNALFERFLELSGLPTAPKQAWTDVARLSEAGIDAVNFGPGLTGQAHQRGEYCEVALLVEAHRALERFLRAEL